MGNRVLVVDDEKLIVKGIKFSLAQESMEVDTAYDGEEACNLFNTNKYDLIILDIMLPKRNGFEVCQYIRETSNVPIIMLTAKDSDMDKILGLEYGADDYLTKPFNILELKARMKAILRRSKNGQTVNVPEIKEDDENVISSRGLTLNIPLRRVTVNGEEVSLTMKEFDLLKLMMTNQDKIYSREMLLKELWSSNNNFGDERTVDVHVRRLREKIEKKPSEPQYIYTKWGVGYYFKK